MQLLSLTGIFPCEAESAGGGGSASLVIMLVILVFALFAALIWLYTKNRELTLKIQEKEFEIKTLENNSIDFYENSPFVSFSLNPRGNITDCNTHAYKLLGLKRVDIWGKPLRKFFDTLPTGQFEEFLRHSFEKKYGAFRVEFRNSSGETVSGSAFCASSFNFSGELVSVRMTVQVDDCIVFAGMMNESDK
ncbi:MAG: PAS domain-containing protein [Firmicutes bacterium]|nr:PAS domain-containing protein [Bacillota bacterium]